MGKREISRLYSAYLSAVPAIRVQTLTSVAALWDDTIKSIMRKQPLPADKTKSFDRAVSCRRQAAGAGTPEEADAALRAALKIYEGIWPAALPTIVPTLNEFDSNRAMIEGKAAARAKKFNAMLALINGVYGKYVTFHVADSAVAEEVFDPRNMWWNFEHAELQMAAWKQNGDAAFIASLLGTVAQVFSLARTADGSFTVDSRALYATLPQLSNALATSFSTAAIRPAAADPVTPVAPADPVTVPADPSPAASASTDPSGGKKRRRTASAGTPRPARVPRDPTGTKVGGLFNPGSAIAEMYEYLLARVSTQVPVSEFMAYVKSITTADAESRTKALVRLVNMKGTHRITRTSTYFRMDVV